MPMRGAARLIDRQADRQSSRDEKRGCYRNKEMGRQIDQIDMRDRQRRDGKISSSHAR